MTAYVIVDSMIMRFALIAHRHIDLGPHSGEADRIESASLKRRMGKVRPDQVRMFASFRRSLAGSTPADARTREERMCEQGWWGDED